MSRMMSDDGFMLDDLEDSKPTFQAFTGVAYRIGDGDAVRADGEPLIPQRSTAQPLIPKAQKMDIKHFIMQMSALTVIVSDTATVITSWTECCTNAYAFAFLKDANDLVTELLVLRIKMEDNMTDTIHENAYNEIVQKFTSDKNALLVKYSDMKRRGHAFISNATNDTDSDTVSVDSESEAVRRDRRRVRRRQT